MHKTQIIPRQKVANESPIYELFENDQIHPAGIWRLRVQGDIVLLERALDTLWTTDEDWVAYDKGNETIRFIKAIATLTAPAFKGSIQGAGAHLTGWVELGMFLLFNAFSRRKRWLSRTHSG